MDYQRFISERSKARKPSASKKLNIFIKNYATPPLCKVILSSCYFALPSSKGHGKQYRTIYTYNVY